MTEIFQNIREIYDFAAPCGELAPFIEFFSQSSEDKCVQHFAKGHQSVTMFKSWTPTFFINLSGSYLVDLNGRQHIVGKQQDILVLRDGTITRHNQEQDRIFTVKFYPGGLEAMFNISQSAIAGKVIDLRTLLPAAFLSRLKQPVTFEMRIKLIEEQLLIALHNRKSADYYLRIVNDAIGEYSTGGMQLQTNQIAERLFVTSKSINRYFHRVIGVSPKRYFSVLRARTALNAMMADRSNFSSFDYGYYDPAHFYKDIGKFTGYKFSDQLYSI